MRKPSRPVVGVGGGPARRVLVDGIDPLASDPRATDGQPDGWGWDWERWR